MYRPDFVTYILASWRFGISHRFVCKKIGYVLSIEHGRCESASLMAPINHEPWSLARVDKLRNGIWMFHAENPIEGVGFFLEEDFAKYSVSQMRIQNTVFKYDEASLCYLNYLDPMWPSIDLMEDSFFDDPIEGWEDTFKDSIRFMRSFKGARKLYAAYRIRNDHPLLCLK